MDEGMVYFGIWMGVTAIPVFFYLKEKSIRVKEAWRRDARFAKAAFEVTKDREARMSRKIFRQGDVLIREVLQPVAQSWSDKFRTARENMKTVGKAISAGVETLRDADVSTIPRDKGRVVLAYGEVSGHSHAIADKTTEFFQCDDGRRILLVNAPETELSHEEHGTIKIPKGEYEIIHQREYDPELHSRAVLD